MSVTYGIGGAIGAVLASRIIAAFGWRAAFTDGRNHRRRGHAACNSIGFATRSEHGPRAAAGSFKDALTAPILILALAEFIGGSVFWSSAAWTPTLLRTAKALSLQETGWIMGVLSLANMLGSFSLGIVVRQIRPQAGHRAQRLSRGAGGFYRVLLVAIDRSPGIGYFCFRYSQSFGAGIGRRARPGGRAAGQRRRRQRHHHVASLHLGRRGAADCRAAHSAPPATLFWR